MKNLFKVTTLILALLIFSCGKDEDTTNEDQVAENLESTPLSANHVSDNVIIKGGTKEEGVPPTPNESISLELGDEKGTAYLNEGFTIPLSSDGNITGAYIQFKSNDGTVSDSYYDVNIQTNITGKKNVVRKHFGPTKLSQSLSNKVDDVQLDIDFNSEIEPGTFCYIICVYDGEGNISAPGEVCVTVESWGGNANMVGSWKLTKDEYTEEGKTVTTNVGEPNCDEEGTLYCNNGETSFTYQECSTIEFFDITFKSDGTYEYASESSEKDRDYTASTDNCEAVYEEYSYGYSSSGNWAFIADENRLTLVEYSWVESDDDQDYPGSYEPGEAYLLYDGVIELNANTFVLTDAVDYDGDGTIDRTDKFYFEK